LKTLVRRHGLDALIVIVALESALEVALREEAKRAPQTTHWFAVPAIAGGVLVLLLRRRFPFGAPAAFVLFYAGVSFVDGRLVVFTYGAQVAGLIAGFLLGNLPNPRQERLGLAVVLGGIGVIVYNDPNRSAGELVFIPILFATSWLMGFALRERSAQAAAAEARASQAEREREAAARLAVAEERARIARELHDVVAHAVSVMVLQVGAVRHMLPAELGEEGQALGNVERAGRTALAEMRRLLGAMRNEGDELELGPQPGLESLEPLLDEIRRAGLPVELHVEGEPFALPRALDLSAYRIVQEGLTNALKHARAGRADVSVRYGEADLWLEVRDDGAGPATTDGLGHGLVGVGERVKLYGGEMNAGPGACGGYVLSAKLPLEGE
jgi:signal transduction histidine kinase